LEDQIDRIFYKPINLTKTLKSLEIVNENTNKSKTPQVELHKSNEKFENIHALVAEDNSINQKLIQNVLNGLGVDVTLADNGKEAFELRQENDYDIIFMDIQMPVMGGIEATGKILEFEEQHRKHHVPVVAVTANALEGDREKYINEGMDNYLSKPIELGKIKLLIEEYVSHKIVKNEKETIDNDNTQNSDDTVEVKEVIEQKRRSDVLVYHSMPLIANLYGSILKNLDYDKDIVTDEEVFLDRLDDTEYTFVLYEAEPFVKMPCMIVDLIKDSGAKPFALIHNLLGQDKPCCDTLEEKANIAEVRKKFQIDQ
jgi:CheY-like chemotaxis protein